MITLNDLTVGYNANAPLFENFNKKFENKIYGILGQSGCGKTTLLRTIAGLKRPIKGKIFIDGEEVGRGNVKNAYMLHQSYTSFDWKDCVGNVLIAKEIKGKIKNEDIKMAEEMLDRVGLSAHRHKYPRQLSGGQRQRLALARTLFMKPQNLLMDEPLSALDSETRNNMQGLILKLHQNIKNTIIIVTHSSEEAKRMCDEIIRV